MDEEFCPDHGLVAATPNKTCPYCSGDTVDVDDGTWYGVLVGPARAKTGIERQNDA